MSDYWAVVESGPPRLFFREEDSPFAFDVYDWKTGNWIDGFGKFYGLVLDGDPRLEIWPQARVEQAILSGTAVATKYSPDQPRDDHGRFGEGDGGSASTAAAGASASTGGPGTGKQLSNDTIQSLFAKYDLTASYGVNETAEDGWLHELVHAQGFDAKPEVVTEEELQKAIAAGDTEIWRGVNGDTYVEQFKTGDYFAGRGYYGNGTYTSADRDTARNYSNGSPGSIMHMALSSDAKVISRADLSDKIRSEHGFFDLKTEGEKATYFDPGRAAAAMGYDAIYIKDASLNSDFYVVLNRGAVKVAK